MTLPKTVKIGMHTYGVEEVVDLNKDGIELLGHADSINLMLRVEKNQASTMKANTFVHEVIHGMLDNTILRNVPNNEDITISLTEPLLQLIVDNPALIRYINKEFKKKEIKEVKPVEKKEIKEVEVVKKKNVKPKSTKGDS